MKRAVSIVLVLFSSACSSSADSPPSTASDAGTSSAAPSPSSPVTGNSPSPTGGDADAGAPVADASVLSNCDASACGSLVGFVQRTSTAPTHGGKGNVYVAVFDGDPVTNAATAVMVARSLLPNEDLSAATAQVAYRVDGIPFSATPYQVIAFLDDADAVSASSPQPASGDLISLQISNGISGVPATISSAGDVTLDLPLNAVMP
jgi:hypothetical protein